ncbi:MAG: SM-20-related protein [Blastocatellia bacterium]|jgi:predicted 2-oxoglutarate/Fe(II)-dependent dioxygenase YbiX|nr:SM-20-related protein [Blastocatellia bacterium]
MPNSAFFAKLGIFIRPNLLPAELCGEIVDEMLLAPQNSLAVVDGYTATDKIKSSVRRTKGATVSETIVARIHGTLRALHESLEVHFGVTLVGCEEPQFLVYTEGDFFRPHADGDHAPEKPAYIRKRKISVVIFLNSETHSGSFEGGGLVLYGLPKDPRWKQYGFPLMGEAGMLIAFPSDVVHEVKAILRGSRCSIVSWFY